MIAEGLRFLMQSVAATRHKVNELEYSDKPLTLLAPPLPQGINVDTLLALESLVGMGLDGCTEPETFVHVKDYHRVDVRALRGDKYGQRQLFISATLENPCPFTFGQFHEPEKFIIALNTGFVETPELKKLIALASGLTAENVAVAEDDGISQKATIRSGVSLKQTAKIEPKVKLQPYRTFREVEQPASMFLFRLKNEQEGQPPRCALFEADGGAWKIDAVKNIAKWFKGKLANVVS